MFKFGCYKNNKLQEHYYSDIYNAEQKSSYERIIIGLERNQIDIVLDLAAVLNGPLYILYILHTPSTDNEPGRYQSKALAYDGVRTLLNRFKKFFENDARHDIWIHSSETNTTIVYDRHNLIYLYGFSDEHVFIIEKKGLHKESFITPCHHVHRYNSEYDIFESQLINEYQWIRTSLHEEDRQ